MFNGFRFLLFFIGHKFVNISYNRVQIRLQDPLFTSNLRVRRKYFEGVMGYPIAFELANANRTPLMMATESNLECIQTKTQSCLVSREVSALPYADEISRQLSNASDILDTIRILVEEGSSDVTELCESSYAPSNALQLYKFHLEDPLNYMIKLTDQTQIKELLAAARWLRSSNDIRSFDHRLHIYEHIAKLKVLPEDRSILNRAFIETALLVWLLRERGECVMDLQRLSKLQEVVKSFVKSGACVHSDGMDCRGEPGTATSRLFNYRAPEAEDAEFMVFLMRWWIAVLHDGGIDLSKFAKKELRMTRNWSPTYSGPMDPKRSLIGLTQLDLLRITQNEHTEFEVRLYQQEDCFWWAFRTSNEEGNDGDEQCKDVNIKATDGTYSNQEEGGRYTFESSSPQRGTSTIMPGTWID